MKQGETIAIIGAENKWVSAIVSKLSHSTHRVLVLDEALEKDCATSAATIHPNAQVEKIGCCREASWEADIILLSEDIENFSSTLDKMIEVATNKIVALVSEKTNKPFPDVQSILPFSKLVIVRAETDSGANSGTSYHISGRDKNAVNFISELFQSIGLLTTASIN